MDYLFCVLGLVLIFEGVPYFAFPDKIKPFVRKLLEKPDEKLRWFGLILMVSGLLLVYMGRNGTGI